MPWCERLEALAPEESPALRPNRCGNLPTHWLMPRPPKDGEVAVHARALDGPAIWHDPQLTQAFSFRGDVVAAMADADVARHWRLIRCRAIPLH